MTETTHAIPFQPPLPWAGVFGRRVSFAESLGWRPRFTQFYYLARNAIWHGVDCLGLKPGDGVLLPAYHHGVEIDVVVARGLRPAFYGIRRDLGADPAEIESLVDGSTRALYVTHYLGFPQPIRALQEIAIRRGLLLLEDCALSLYSRAPEGPLGSFGDMSIFCLYKTLPVPHGGMLALNREGARAPHASSRPDEVSTATYVAHRALDALALSGGGIGPRAARWLRRLARGLKGAMGAKPVAIDTDRFDLSLADLGIAPLTRRILDRTDAEHVIAIRRRNYARLLGAVDPNVRPVVNALPDGVAPLSFPIFVEDKPSTQERLARVGVHTVNMWFRPHPRGPSALFPDVTFLRRHLLEVPIHQGVRPEHVDYIADQVNRLAGWPR